MGRLNLDLGCLQKPIIIAYGSERGSERVNMLRINQIECFVT